MEAAEQPVEEVKQYVPGHIIKEHVVHVETISNEENAVEDEQETAQSPVIHYADELEALEVALKDKTKEDEEVAKG